LVGTRRHRALRSTTAGARSHLEASAFVEGSRGGGIVFMPRIHALPGHESNTIAVVLDARIGTSERPTPAPRRSLNSGRRHGC
jgi:hypothetical protein